MQVIRCKIAKFDGNNLIATTKPMWFVIFQLLHRWKIFNLTLKFEVAMVNEN